MNIRKATTDADIKKVAELATIIWHEHFKVILSPEQIDYMVEKFQSYNAIKKAVTEDGYVYYMAESNDDLLGYLGIRDEGEGVIFISKVYVRNDKRRCGIATQLLERLKNDFPEARKWYLTVNKYNYGSISVYEKRGFNKVKDLVTDIGNGFVMDDYVMEKEL